MHSIQLLLFAVKTFFLHECKLFRHILQWQKSPLQSHHQWRWCDASSEYDGFKFILLRWLHFSHGIAALGRYERSATVGYSEWIRRHHLYLLSCYVAYTRTQLRFYSSSSTHGHANNFCAIHVFFCSSFSLPVRLQLEFNGQSHLALTQFSQMENKAPFSSHLFHGRNKPFACSVWFSFAHSLGWLVSRAPIHQTFFEQRTASTTQQHTLRRSFYISWITHLPLFHVMHSFVSKLCECVCETGNSHSIVYARPIFN